jgi:hypothetical protein
VLAHAICLGGPTSPRIVSSFDGKATYAIISVHHDQFQLLLTLYEPHLPSRQLKLKKDLACAQRVEVSSIQEGCQAGVSFATRCLMAQIAAKLLSESTCQ